MVKIWGRKRFYISCTYFCTIFFMVKILLVTLGTFIFNILEPQSWKNVKMWRLKRWWYLPKLLTITITKLILMIFSDCKRIWNCNLEGNLIVTLQVMAIYTVLYERLYTILRKIEPKRREITNYSFKVFKIWDFWDLQNVHKTTVELTFTTQKANACSPWTVCLFLTGNILLG